MALKNNKFMTTRSKTVVTKSANEAAYDVSNIHVVRLVTISMTRVSTQNSMEVLSVSTPVFGSTSPNDLFSHTGVYGCSFVSMEKTFAMFEFGSGSKLAKHEEF